MKPERIEKIIETLMAGNLERTDGPHGEHLIAGQWYIGLWGCDTVADMLDRLREVLAHETIKETTGKDKQT